MNEVSDLIKIDVLTRLKKGDALNRPGFHIVLFDSYYSDGSINVYEASGSQSRVVLPEPAMEPIPTEIPAGALRAAFRPRVGTVVSASISS
jgi:hypothetical protein